MSKEQRMKSDFTYDNQHLTYQSVTTQLNENNETEIIIRDVEPTTPVKTKKFIPSYQATLKSRIVEVPEEIYEASGIMILGQRIKSLLFTTDVAIIKNSNAQSVMAVYPFTPQLTIMQAILNVSSAPVFLGVGGGTTTGKRSVDLAFQAEQLGGYGVVVNAPMQNEVIKQINEAIDIPVIATVSSPYDDYIGKLESGADMLNISGGAGTAALVAKIRAEVGPTVPIIATGGPTGDTITETIQAGANAITYTPPASEEIFATLMEKYREDSKHKD